MKNLIKLILIVGILVALFGAARVKGWINFGVDKGVDMIDVGAQKVKESGVIDKYGSKIKQSIADGAGGLINGALGK